MKSVGVRPLAASFLGKRPFDRMRAGEYLTFTHPTARTRGSDLAFDPTVSF